MRFCKNCNSTAENCTCELYDTLSWTIGQFDVPDQFVRDATAQFRKRSVMVKSVADAFADSAITARNVRVAYIWSVGSIQTVTSHIDRITQEIDAGNFKTLKNFLENTSDGQKKWELAHDFWTSEVPEIVAKHARNGDWLEAQAELTGLTKANTDRRGRKDDNKRSYMRVTKANMVTRILGDPHALCIDSRRYDVLQTVLQGMLDDAPMGHSNRGPYRVRGTDVGEAQYPAWDHRWLSRVLTRNPEEYRAVTKRLLDRLEDELPCRRRDIGHVLFLMGGDATAHESLQELLN